MQSVHYFFLLFLVAWFSPMVMGSQSKTGEGNAFMLESISITYPAQLTRFGSSSTQVNGIKKGKYWELPYSAILDQGTLTLKWSLKNELKNTEKGKTLMKEIRKNLIILGKKRGGHTVNFGAITRADVSSVTKTISIAQVDRTPGWPCLFALQIRRKNDSGANSKNDLFWIEIRLETAEQAKKRIGLGRITPNHVNHSNEFEPEINLA